MKIEMLNIDSIQPYEQNPRDNSAAVDPVADSIREFGFKVPVIVDGEGILIAGHTRVLAAKKLGMKKVPAIRADDLSAEQVRAFRLADNKLHELSSWDMQLLPIELTALRDDGFDLGLIGFDEQELANLLSGDVKDGLTDPDEVPEPPDDPISQPGDLWILGNHRLLCGDSGSVADLDRLLDGQKVHLVNTDPPYGVKVEPRSNNAIAAGNSSFKGTGKNQTHHQQLDLSRHPEKAKGTHKQMRPKDRPLVNDFVSDEEFERLLDAWFGNIARVLEPGRAAYIWGGYANCANYPPVLKKHKLYFSQAIIWHKMHPVLTRKDFMGDHEWCFYCWREGSAHQFYGPNNATDVWQVKKINPQSMEHLTAKPAELAVRAMQYSTVAGENVLDLFGGSGSTLIGAEQTGRKAYLIEIDPAYTDLIVDRYQRFTGQLAVLERTGESPIPMKPREESMR
ncbi:MAG: DNA methyltransferase [Phycisphaeraceae bacterium]